MSTHTTPRRCTALSNNTGMTINEFKDLLKKVINVPGAIAELDSIGVFAPDGLICMWSGSTVPTGWLLCDGTNGTPDLADKFVLGGVVADIGTTAAEQTTVIANHSDHVVTQPTAHPQLNLTSAASVQQETVEDAGGNTEIVNIETHTHGVTVPSQSHTGTAVDAHSAHAVSTQYFPPYYTLAYIMKGAAA